MLKTEEEIKNQIEGLIKMKSQLPKMNFFGENNHEKIDAQIAHLKRETSIEDFDIDEDESIYLAIDEVEQWLNGESEDDLFELND